MRAGSATRRFLLEEGVVVAVRRGAAAEEPKLRHGYALVPRAGWDQGGVAGSNVPALVVDLELTLSFEHEVDLLARPVVVPLRRLTRCQGGLGQALPLRVMQLADRRSVFGRERRR